MITNISLTNRSGLDQIKAGDRVIYRSFTPTMHFRSGTVTAVSVYGCLPVIDDQNDRYFLNYVIAVKPEGVGQGEEHIESRWV